MDPYSIAFYGAIKKLQKKLEDMELTVDFFPEKPMRMRVTGGGQIGMEEEEFCLDLIMCTWGDVQINFDGKVLLPVKLMNTLKSGFMSIAGNYMMMQHWLTKTSEG
jgi:hypothetical protein